MSIPVRACAALAFVLCASAAVCAPVNPIVGIWQTSSPGHIHVTISLNADGSETQTIDQPGRFTRINARYTTKDGIFTETFLRASVNGKPKPPTMKVQSFRYDVTATTLTLKLGRNKVVFTRYNP